MKKHQIRFHSFQTKISAAFVLLTAVFVLLTAVLVAVTLTQMYRTQTGERLSFETRQLRDNFNRVVNSVNECANGTIIQLNSDPNISLTQVAQQNPLGLGEMKFVVNVALNNLQRAPDVTTLNILFDSGLLCRVGRNLPVYVIEASGELRGALDALPVTTRGGFYRIPQADGSDALYYCKQLRDADTNTRIGTLYLELDAATLREYCVSTQGSSIVLTDGDTVLAATGALPVDSGFTVPQQSSGRLKQGGTTWLYQSATLTRTGWRVTCLLDENDAMASIRRAVLLLAAAASAVMLTMTVITMLIARRLSRPVRDLSTYMVSSAGQMPMPIPVPAQNDEIATLYASFNSMLQQNRQLFSNFKTEQKQKNRLELALVQSQIKPHFLYNTLDTIYCLAGMGREEEAAAVTKALADYYRLVLNRGEEKVTIERELAALQRYLAIMQVRYRDMLTVTIGCEDDVKDVVVPKLLLQPLVENAIYHGIKPKQAPGHLDIHAARSGEAVELTVTDDGVGMTQERFAQAIEGGAEGEPDGESFGMHNTVRRLQLFFGESSHLALRSHDGLTTVAVIIYPNEARDV